MHKRQALAHLLDASGALTALDRLPGRHRLVTFNYHRIGTPPENPYDPGLWSADTDAFARQVAYLKRHYDIITPDDLDDVMRARRGRYVMITFDDGYSDNHACAFPILRAAGVPATFFIATGYIDHPRVPWWDEIAWMTSHATNERIELPEFLPRVLTLAPGARIRTLDTLLQIYKELPAHRTRAYLDALAMAIGSGRHPEDADGSFWMTWDMLREMHQGGMCIAGHTVNHPVLSSLPRAAQGLEIEECQARLSAEIGHAPKVFSYPVGGQEAFNDDTRACLRAAGIDYAFSYYGGYENLSRCDPYNVRRVRMEPEVDDAWFHAIARLPEVFA